MILVLVAIFIVFLMATSGHRKKKLHAALKDLETERLKMLKSIEHVKLSYYQKRLGDKEAQDKIFEFEEKLRQIESKILDLKEKPLMRTLKNQKMTEKDIAEEKAEVEKDKQFATGYIESKTIVILFIIVAIAVVLVIAATGRTTEGRGDYVETMSVPLSARIVPTESVPPGSTAGLRVEIKNPHDFPLTNVFVTASAPEQSGIRFEEGELSFKKITELESQGVRDLYYEVLIDQTTEDGEYVIDVEAVNEDGVKSKTTARLTVRFGAEENV